MMRLVEQGLVDLGEKVKVYVPELKLKDKFVEDNVTVLHLFNHTAGWSGDILTDTGDGDDALEKYVALLADADQETPLGKAASYNNAALSLAGRIIEKITGKTYEQAIKELIFEPLGLDHHFFFTNDIMTRKFVVGHVEENGKLKVARPWALPRGGNPAGGMSATVGDLVKWARFHLGDGSPILQRETLDRMKQPTFEMRGSAIGDYVGISWLMRDVDGVRVVEHGGNTIGQSCSFQMIPERSFAVVVLCNAGETAAPLQEELVRWSFEHYAGVIERDPQPIDLPDDHLAQYAGRYETVAMISDISVSGGRLIATAEVKPEVWAQISQDDPPDEAPLPLGMLSADGDAYVVTGGPAAGMKGYFTRDDDGRVDAVHFGGRLALKVG
jgi:CubicO group peptidase (beta-lactamase class C family)